MISNKNKISTEAALSTPFKVWIKRVTFFVIVVVVVKRPCRKTFT